MTPLETILSEIKARADAAGPEEWKASLHEGEYLVEYLLNGQHTRFAAICYDSNKAKFIAHARTDVPKLVAAVEFLLHADCDIALTPREQRGKEIMERELTKILQGAEGSDD